MNKKHLKGFFAVFLERLKTAGVTGTSVQIAYYTLLALIPLVIALGNLLPLMDIDPVRAMSYLEVLLPDVVQPALDPIIRGILTSGNGGLFIISLAIFVWSASKAIAHLQRGFDRAYGLTATRDAIPQRILSLVVTLLLLIILFASVMIFSLGSFVLEQLAPLSGGLATFARLVRTVKWPVMLFFVFLMLTLVYLFTPCVRVRLREALAGALVATAGTIILSELFSFYVRRISPLLSNYGALSSFLVLLLWLNFTAIIINVGSVVNASLKEYKTGVAASGVRAFHSLVEEKFDLKNIAGKIHKKSNK